MTPRAGYELYISPYLSHAYRDKGSEGAVLISTPSSIPGSPHHLPDGFGATPRRLLPPSMDFDCFDDPEEEGAQEHVLDGGDR